METESQKTSITVNKIILCNRIRELTVLLDATLRVLSVEDNLTEATSQLIETAISEIYDCLLNSE